MTFAPRHLLVPVDVGVDADRALVDELVDAAISIAQRYGAQLTLAHAAPPLAAYVPVGPDFTSAAYTAMATALAARDLEAQAALGALVARGQAAGVTTQSALLGQSGSVPELIAAAATSLAADLIVVTTHGRRGVKRLLLGSVAERVAHLSPVPVLLWKPRAEHGS